MTGIVIGLFMFIWNEVKSSKKILCLLALSSLILLPIAHGDVVMSGYDSVTVFDYGTTVFPSDGPHIQWFPSCNITGVPSYDLELTIHWGDSTADTTLNSISTWFVDHAYSPAWPQHYTGKINCLDITGHGSATVTFDVYVTNSKAESAGGGGGDRIPI